MSVCEREVYEEWVEDVLVGVGAYEITLIAVNMSKTLVDYECPIHLPIPERHA